MGTQWPELHEIAATQSVAPGPGLESELFVTSQYRK